MKTLTSKALWLVAALFLAIGNAGAEDIDIYASNASTGTPNLLTVIDNSGSWSASTTISGCPDGAIDSTMLSTAGGFEACGFYNALTQIQNSPVLLGKLRMGLMMFGQGSTQGGVFQSPPASPAPGDLNLMDAAGITAMQKAVTNLKQGSGSDNNTANGTDVGGSMQEAWAYYTAHTGLSGTTYTGPASGGACGKNFVLFIGISRTSSNPADFNSNKTLAALQAAGATADQQTYINYQYDMNGDNQPDTKYVSPTSYWGDEWTRFNKQNQNIVTYTIVLKDPKNPNPDYEAFLKSMALHSGGKFFEVDLGDMDALVQALLLIFNEVQAVNSVFASASLPISVNAQGTFLNQIYMGMFRPDANGLPRWMGNMKQYQFAVDNTNPSSPQLFMADSTGAPAISSAGTGFISPNAISFWTSTNPSTLPDSIGGFWVNNPQGVSQGLDSADGEVVEKGGVGQQIRLANLQDNYTTNPSSPRNVFTCTGTCANGSSLSATPFATTNSGITDALLGTTLPAVSVSKITRSGTTATATVSSMNPALTSGQFVTVSGSQYSQFNGTFSAGGPPTSTTFTYTTTTSPPTPATGSYTASVTSAGAQSVTSLSRSGTTVTATVPGHGFVVGQSITIAGATGTEYNGTFAVTSVPTGNTFTYTITDGPTTPSSGGSATKLGSGILLTISSVVRQPSNSSNQSVVTVTTTAANTYAIGDTVQVSGTSVSAYNSSWTVTGVGGSGSNSCPGGVTTKGKPFSFCFVMNTTPASPDVTTGMTADVVASVATITGLTRTTSTCTGASPSPAATVTATTSAANGFSTGQTVNIGGTPGSNEALYVGSFPVTVVDSTHFTYSINTTPACSDTTSGMTAATFGVDKNTLINWTRGFDSVGDEPSPGNGITIRPSVHGDVLHSRPAVIDYPSTGVVVFYGSNDGVFRAINGNQTGNIGSTPPGGELWSFIPTEFYSKLQRLYFNSPVVKLSSTLPGIVPTPQPKDYFFDGGTGIYQNPTTGQAFIFLSARRGGRVLYAIDVSDPTAPKFMWKHTNTDTGFSELGQTWSTPKVALVKGYSNPVLIFGAGYDTNEDNEPPTTDTMGRGIFILDAVTGDLIWQANSGGPTNSCSGTPCRLQDMTYAMPADITLIDRNTDGLIDRLYAVDLGGNIWRVDLEPTSGNTPDHWQVNKFAAVGGASTDPTKRKLFFPPDVVATKNFDAVALSTGDREHPTIDNASLKIINRFYMLKDTNTGNDATGWTPIQDNTSSTANDQPASPGSSDLFNATSTNYDNTGSGFYITLLSNTDKNGNVLMGEKGVNAPTTVGGNTFFGTNTPEPADPSTCQANLGIALGYSVNIVTGFHQYVLFSGGGLPPSPVTGLVAVNVNGETKYYPFLIGGGNASPDCTGPDCTSALGGTKPPIPITPIRSRTYWYREHDK